jgi:hypothetical protein
MGLGCIAVGLWMGDEGLGAMRAGALVQVTPTQTVPGWWQLGAAVPLVAFGICLVAAALGLIRLGPDASDPKSLPGRPDRLTPPPGQSPR